MTNLGHLFLFKTLVLLLCLAEGGEVTHYEVLSSISKNFEIKELSSTVNSILKEEQDHLQSCLNLAKENVS